MRPPWELCCRLYTSFPDPEKQRLCEGTLLFFCDPSDTGYCIFIAIPSKMPVVAGPPQGHGPSTFEKSTFGPQYNPCGTSLPNRAEVVSRCQCK
ncbi:hypothetical protein BO70DRAFT_83278 [Aspergillus heteromorphus CBS 117.55]|uniref:Uncharacterized protein n=1 Tax=Aspergillus heteromorphus CBS 117.55 TaxID=1448321 RepID=A0A317WX90_9EURO|nr:uncharacterized protein BO70DRAFT_83278 [Aspergillus heteromorphus CBS 117.55]PWY91026.1 hypothetical protein BO70DRAFT_83278 [Aspergillus heteromorphus CBS 117.55]